MAQRINEDIRFYLPADPYYYQVDNLPLEDLLANDVRLQNQIDSIQSSDGGNTVGRAGFTELQPFIDTGLPGTISVRPGNFTGRTQRSSFSDLAGGAPEVNDGFDGLMENNSPPTNFGSGDKPTGTYSVHNPGSLPQNPNVGRTAVFNFKGGSISIDAFGFDDFEDWVGVETIVGNTTPPAGRIDLIGITTMNGAMDDPWVPGNAEPPGVLTGDGFPRLAVAKGAGIVLGNGRREVVIGERFLTVGESHETLNEYGRNLEGDIVPNPEFGTIPSPDDVVNVNFARNLMANGEIAQSLQEWASSNRNANFFLPLAYVYVPQSHVEGAPIPEQYLKDIRPFFRTAELALAERQAIAASLAPSVSNPFVTEEHAKTITGPALSDLTDTVSTLAARIAELEEDEGQTSMWKVYPSLNGALNYSQEIPLPAGDYVAYSTWNQGSPDGEPARNLVIGVNSGTYTNPNYPNLTYFSRNINGDDDTIATHSFFFHLAEQGTVQLCSPFNPPTFATGTLQKHKNFDLPGASYESGDTVGFILAVKPGPYGF